MGAVLTSQCLGTENIFPHGFVSTKQRENGKGELLEINAADDCDANTGCK